MGTPPPAAAPPPVQAEAALTATDPPQIEAPFAEAPPRRFEGRAFSDKRFPVGRAAHLPAIRAQAAAARVPVDLADAVATVESAYDPHAVGLVDEIGLMQVRPAIARQLGFKRSTVGVVCAAPFGSRPIWGQVSSQQTGPTPL